jgi:hypothetical protein
MYVQTITIITTTTTPNQMKLKQGAHFDVAIEAESNPYMYMHWYVAKRTHLLILWIAGSVLLGGSACYLNWNPGAVWSVFAVLGFVVIEKSLTP